MSRREFEASPREILEALPRETLEAPPREILECLAGCINPLEGLHHRKCPNSDSNVSQSEIDPLVSTGASDDAGFAEYQRGQAVQLSAQASAGVAEEHGVTKPAAGGAEQAGGATAPVAVEEERIPTPTAAKDDAVQPDTDRGIGSTAVDAETAERGGMTAAQAEGRALIDQMWQNINDVESALNEGGEVPDSAKNDTTYPIIFAARDGDLARVCELLDSGRLDCNWESGSSDSDTDGHQPDDDESTTLKCGPVSRCRYQWHYAVSGPSVRNGTRNSTLSSRTSSS